MLSIIQVGHNEASDRYIRNKVKAIMNEGLRAVVVNLPEDCTTENVVSEIAKATMNGKCSAIMVQLPLPPHIDKKIVLDHIPHYLDIDGLNPKSDYKPLTPCAIMRWFREQDISLEGKSAVVLGRSDLVGKPLANMLIDAGATVTVCNSHTDKQDAFKLLTNADIIVSAVGKANYLGLKLSPWFKKQVVVVDVGINKDADGKLCGDVSFGARYVIHKNDGICTPVPGGVGKWTVRELIIRLKEMEGVE